MMASNIPPVERLKSQTNELRFTGVVTKFQMRSHLNHTSALPTPTNQLAGSSATAALLALARTK
jgi:hypothetical protein